MNQQPQKRRALRGQQQQPLDGPVVRIYTRQGNSQYPLPRDIQPRDVVNFLMQNPSFANLHNTLQAPDTGVEVIMYSFGNVVKGPFTVKSRTPGPVMSQNGVPIPSENLGHLNPQNQQGMLPPEDQFDSGIFSKEDRRGMAPDDGYDQVTAGDLIRMKIESLERQADYLKSLVPVVDQFPVESPEELGMRELLRAGVEKE